MRPISVTQTGAGSSVAIPLDFYGRSEISLQVVVSGTVNFTVQQTLDDPAASPTWFAHPDTALAAATASAQGNYAYIPRAVRLTVNSGAGSATLTILQAGLMA